MKRLCTMLLSLLLTLTPCLHPMRAGLPGTAFADDKEIDSPFFQCATWRDAEHADPYSTTASTEEAEYSQKRRQYFDDFEAKNGRTGREFTMVSGLYELYGLPVMDQYYWKDDGDWMGAGSAFQSAVRDNGELCHAQIDGLPQVVSAEPLELSEFNWQELLRQVIAYLCVSNATGQDTPYENEDGESCIAYATYAVLTDLKPCWVGDTSDTLVPGWYCVAEERVMKDDSVAAIWSQYGDAETLMALGE